MWAAGKLLPRADRSPAIEPIAEGDLRLRISQHPELVGFRVGKTVRIKSAFYTSQAMEILRA
jgi:magnesium-protoporphyrin O-methyltransferase